MDAVASAMNKAHREAPKDKKASQKSVVLDNLNDVVADVSGPKRQSFGERQVLYKLRPLVMKATGQELTTGNFKGIITDYENEHGEILKMYREPRGSIYHPHLKETIPISTLMVARYKRPLSCYNKLGGLQRSTQGRRMV